MNARELGNRIAAVAEEYPPGSRVWHRADGKRGVVCKYAVDGLGCVMLEVCFGGGENWEKCLPVELSGTKVTADNDDESWKDGEGGERV